MARAIILAMAEEEMLMKSLTIERRLLREESRPLLMPNKEFKGLYRLSKRQFSTLCQELVPLLNGSHRKYSVKPGLKILAALAFFAHGGFQKKVGDTNYLGLSQSSTSTAIQDVVQALNNPDILEKYIKFPHTRDEREQVALGFKNKFGFPGVLGCIDGTHVAIVRPKEYEESYYNIKNYHSLNVMVICDSEMKIQYVDASVGGFAKDSQVWERSVVKEFMERLHGSDERYWLLGDSAYDQRGWMMQPIALAAPDSPEEHYTTMHCATRGVVDRCVGVLKTRWRCLVALRALYYQPIKAGLIVNACVVLHNFVADPTLRISSREILKDRVRQPPPEPASNEDTDGSRRALVARLWADRHAS